MNRIKGNEVLAIFMGGTLQTDKSWNFCLSDFGIAISSYGRITQLKFHYDWNWLMHVITRIDCDSEKLIKLESDHKQYDKLQSGLKHATTGNFKMVYNSLTNYCEFINNLKLKNNGRKSD
jgi:hypothetical protein